MESKWTDIAHKTLINGQSVIVQPRGHSMTGLISDRSQVTLEPYGQDAPGVGDIVLTRVPGRRFRHLVLHRILAQKSGRYLIGNSRGMPDGWVTAQEIFGRATHVDPAA
jgi:hypothetical protein